MRRTLLAALLTVAMGVLASPTTAFGSCSFEITSSDVAGLTVGQRITINPCQISVQTSGEIVSSGQATKVQILLQLGLTPSAAQQAGVSITGGTVTVNVVNGGTVILRVDTDAPRALASASLDVARIIGGRPVTGTVTMNGWAPAGGFVVNLSSSDTSTATVPAQVTIAAGQTNATFTVTTTQVTQEKAVDISATAGTVTKPVKLSVLAAPAPGLLSVRLRPNTVTGGRSATGTVTLSGRAPSEGMTVTLSSTDTAVATLPSSQITIPAGETTATFAIQSQTVTTRKSVTISSALRDGKTKTATLTVEPGPR